MLSLSGDKETLVGHQASIEIYCLWTHFLKTAPENKLDAIVAGKRKLGSWTCRPGEVSCSYKEQNICKYFIKEVTREEKKHIITNTVTNNATKCKIVDIT